MLMFARSVAIMYLWTVFKFSSLKCLIGFTQYLLLNVGTPDDTAKVFFLEAVHMRVVFLNKKLRSGVHNVHQQCCQRKQKEKMRL